MTKYIIYADDDERPGKQVVIKKTKREVDALNFIGDVRNLCDYGCMTVVKTDDDNKYTWNPETSVWEKMED